MKSVVLTQKEEQEIKLLLEILFKHISKTLNLAP